jgi:hypothetical protein
MENELPPRGHDTAAPCWETSAKPAAEDARQREAENPAEQTALTRLQTVLSVPPLLRYHGPVAYGPVVLHLFTETDTSSPSYGASFSLFEEALTLANIIEARALKRAQFTSAVASGGAANGSAAQAAPEYAVTH